MTKSKLTLAFLAKAELMYGDTYDYNMVDYKTSRIKVTIICKEHGCFQQAPGNFLRNYGCPTCAITARAKARVANGRDKFKMSATKLHNGKYDYSKIGDYKDKRTKVTIVCPEHGDFQQTPTHHLRPRGCPTCAKYTRLKSYYDVPTILYYLKVGFKGNIAYKIGITSKSVKERYAEDLTDPDFKLEVLEETMFETGKPAYEAEQVIIKEHRQHLYQGEHELIFCGNTELFDRDVLGLDRRTA